MTKEIVKLQHNEKCFFFPSEQDKKKDVCMEI